MNFSTSISSVIILIVSLFVTSSCRKSKDSSEADNGIKQVNANIVTIGDSYENPIVLPARNRSESVQMEQEWIKKNYPDATRMPSNGGNTIGDENEVVWFGHMIKIYNNKTYSVVYITLPNGTNKALFFDMTAYFEK